MKKIYFLFMAILFLLNSCSKDSSTINSSSTGFKLISTAVVDGLLLDAYKCEPKVNGKENSLPLSWSGAPSSANAFAITMVHYPNSSDTINFKSYLVLWGIDKSITAIPYGAADDGPWFLGVNKDGNTISYTSPCSAGSGTHKYAITIYALSSTPTSLPTQSSISVTNSVLMNEISDKIIDKTSLVFNSVTK